MSNPRKGFFSKAVSRLTSAAAGLALGISAATSGPFSETMGYSPDRSSIMYYLPDDSRMYLDGWTRQEINRKAEWLYQSFGIVKEGVNGIARHTVQKGISLQLDSDDEEWNALAEADFECYALSPDRFDIARRRNFYEAQTTAVEQRILRGEFFASHAQNPRWGNAPCVQLWDAQEITTPSKAKPEDRVFDGVQLDGGHAPLQYFAQVAGGSGETTPIDAADMIHWYKPTGINQVRGVSELAQAVNPLVDIHDLRKLVTKGAKLHSALGLIVKRSLKDGDQGALGGVERIGKRGAGANPPAPPPGGTPPVPTRREQEARLEKMFHGAAIMYTAEDGEIKTVSSTQPSPLVEPFITGMLMRDVCAGWGVPMEFFWACSDLNGANTRFILAKADLFFQVMADALIWRFCNPVAVRYLQHRIDTGRLRPPTDENWQLKIGWQVPPRITVDNGRDGALEINQLNAGVENLRNLNDRRGRGWRREITQWFVEWKYAYAEAKRLKVPQAMKFWRASQPGAGGAPTDKPEPDSDETPLGNDPDNPPKKGGAADKDKKGK